MDYSQEGRNLVTTLEVYIRVYSTQLLTVSDIDSGLLLVTPSVKNQICLVLCLICACGTLF